MDISSSIRAQNSFRLSGSVNNINSNTKALHVDMQSIDTGEEAAYLADGFDGGADISFLGDVPDLRSILKTVKQDSTFLFPADKQSIESMASLSGKPLTASEVADAKKHLKEIKEAIVSENNSKPNEPKLQWLNLAESSVKESARDIRAESRKIAWEKVTSEYKGDISPVYEKYFTTSGISPAEMLRILEVSDDLSSENSKMKLEGNNVVPLMRGDIWRTKMSLLDEVAKNPIGKDGKPVEVDAEYYELTSPEMISKLRKAAEAGANVKVIMDPGQLQYISSGIFDASAVALKLGSMEELKRGLPEENMSATFYPIQEKLGGSGEIMHRKIFRVGEDVVFGGMNANTGSNENIDFAMKIRGSAANKIGSMFAEDASYSAGKGIQDVYGSRLEPLLNKHKTVMISRAGLESILTAGFAEQAGLDGTETHDQKIDKLIAAADKAGVNVGELAVFPNRKSQNVEIGNKRAAEFLKSKNKAKIRLNDDGKRLMMKVIKGVFDTNNSAKNIENLQNSVPPEGLASKKSSEVIAVAGTGDERQGVLLNAINSAEKFIKVSCFVMTKDIADVLVEKKNEMERQGKHIDIEVIMDPGIYAYGGTPNEEGYKTLEDAGIKVKWNLLERSTNQHDRKNHSKMMVTDKMLLTGSTNFSSKGLRDNWEDSDVVYFNENNEQSLANQKLVTDDYDRMFSRQAVSVDTHRLAEEEFKNYDGADKEVLKDRFRNTAIRKICAKIDTYERMSATYIANNLPENAPEIEEGIGGYDLLDTLDDEYIDKMRSSLHVWDEIQKMA